MPQPVIFILSFVAAFVFASFVEYWLHRLMHVSAKVGQRHRDHHRRNEGQGVVWEFRDYVLGSAIAMAGPFIFSLTVGLGWASGARVYSAFSAYAHQLQHENPRRCFWMKMPVHYVHHKYGMWNHNFGLGVDWWDHVFGTYKPVEWPAEDDLPELSMLAVRWW